MCLPLAAACATVAAGAFAVVRPAAIDYGEPVVYGQALRLLSGEPLYQPIEQPPFTVAAYTPLYYALAGVLMAWFGPGFGPGRALSLAAGLATSILVASLAAKRGMGWWVGPFAGLLFLALGFPRPDTPWLGLYRVDMLGVAVAVGAVAVLRRFRSVIGDIAAGVLAGLALLCKQTLFAALIAGVLWRGRQSGIFIASALLTFIVPCTTLQLTTGALWQNTVVANVNPYHLVIAAGLLKEFVKVQWLPLVLAAAYLLLEHPWRASESRLLVLYWLAASLSLVLLGNIGANHNYWIEFAAATAVLSARGAACLLRQRPAMATAGATALVLVLGLDFGGPQGLLESARAARSDVRDTFTLQDDVDFSALVERVRHEPHAVIAEPMDVVVLAGRPVLFEPFVYNLMVDEGRWRPDPLVARICEGEIGLLVLAYTLKVGAEMTDGLHSLWPPTVIASLQQTMTLEGIEASRYVYVPGPASAGGGCRQ